MAILWHYSGRGSAEGRVPGKGWERLSSDLGTPGVSRSLLPGGRTLWGVKGALAHHQN